MKKERKLKDSHTHHSAVASDLRRTILSPQVKEIERDADYYQAQVRNG